MAQCKRDLRCIASEPGLILLVASRHDGNAASMGSRKLSAQLQLDARAYN